MKKTFYLIALLNLVSIVSFAQWNIPSTGGTVQWAKIGTFTAGQSGETILLTANIHQGYNALNSQDATYTISFKTSNGSSVDANGFAGNSSWYAVGQNSSIPYGSVKWKANSAGVSATAFDLYMYLPTHTNGSRYNIILSGSSAWTNVGALGQADPGSASSSVLIASQEFNIPNGNVGIGTTSPAGKLDVNFSNGEPKSAVIFSSSNNPIYTPVGGLRFSWYDSNFAEIQMVRQLGATDGLGLSFHTSTSNNNATQERMRIDANGNIGIGTKNPDTKLTVNGAIHATEVKVDLSVPAPDYVFEKSYDLKTLDDIKEFIELNKHLPEIPSAKEMQKSGILVGEMNMKLLKKVEELTLYLIAQNKRIENLELQKSSK